MLKVVISGYGRMGHMIESVLQEKGIVCAGASEDIVSFDDDLARECVCIDFTCPDAFRANYPALASKFKAVVVGTTGWNDIRDEVIRCFEEKGTPMIYSSNYSVGVNVLTAAVEVVSKYLSKAGGYHPYIVEKHHVHKLDAPSGTAITLAEQIVERLDRKSKWGLHETGADILRIDDVRRGEVPGIHTISYDSPEDIITITHDAHSRQGFALGAVLAAEYTAQHQGLLTIDDMFKF